MITTEKLHFIRYPGGKQRITSQIVPHLPKSKSIKGKFVEPFLGSGAVFFLLEPQFAVLSDINAELIKLYRGIRHHPFEVWNIFKKFGSTKEAYYKIRDNEQNFENIAFKAARTLYLNRTCFKGMWRHNAQGQFNVGYGGQARRWVIDQDSLLEVSDRLQNANLLCSDFQPVIESCGPDDFIFVDPPYRPGERELIQSHYVYNRFGFAEHERLAKVLYEASTKSIRWALTISSHPDILHLYRDNRFIALSRGTGKYPGVLTDNPEEVLICNYQSEVA
jgi:DNA adenine methylase